MAKKKANLSSHMQFFDEKSVDIFTPQSSERVSETKSTSAGVPFIPEFEIQEDSNIQSYWKELRKFFSTGLNGGIPKGTLKPLGLANQYTDPERNIPSNYPLWIPNTVDDQDQNTDTPCLPLSALIEQCIKEFAPEKTQAKILKMYVPTILAEASGTRQGSDRTVPIQAGVSDSINGMLQNLDIKGTEGVSFKKDLDTFKKLLPDSGVLVPYSPMSIFHILSSLLKEQKKERHRNLVLRTRETAQKLEEILRVEEENYPSEGKGKKHLKSSFGKAADYFDTDRLSSLLPDSASEHMSKERISRIRKLFRTLGQVKKELQRDSTIIISDDFLKCKNSTWQSIFAGSELAITTSGQLCLEGIKIFNKKMLPYEKIVKAFRIGQLEAQGKYIHEQHGDFFETLNWKIFSEEEIQDFPPILIFVDAKALCEEELDGYTRILSSGAPIKIVAIRQLPEDNTPVEENLKNSQEPTTLGMAFRNTFVAQNTSLSPLELYKEFSTGIHSSSASLFHILIEPSGTESNALLKVSTSVEGRAFPLFVYDGNFNYQWGNRFSITHNPQPEKDWPENEIKIKDENKEDTLLKIPVSCADFLAFYTGSNESFKVIPPEYWTDDLVTISEFLGLPDIERYAKIPFIWMKNEENQIFKVAVSWNVVMSCYDRLEFWRYIQEVGGINNFHVKKALEIASDQIKAESAEELKKVLEEHQLELERVRKETASEAMERLTAALLDLDPDSIITTPAPKPTGDIMKDEVVGTEKEKHEDTIEDIPVEDDDGLSMAEPWIEAPLCTTCNECTDINNRMFKYDKDKLAYIADPKAGTYAELVEAAEKCPVKIIHPGQPLNPSEPGLDELVKIAANFN